MGKKGISMRETKLVVKDRCYEYVRFFCLLFNMVPRILVQLTRAWSTFRSFDVYVARGVLLQVDISCLTCF